MSRAISTALQSGFVYVFSNPGLTAYKVGISTRPLYLRQGELMREWPETEPSYVLGLLKEISSMGDKCLDRISAYRWVIAFMAAASVVVAVLQYATTQSQLTQLKRAADQKDRALMYAQTQAEAAKIQAKTAKDTFEPNVEIQNPVFTQGSPASLTSVVIKNTGAGSATDVYFRTNIFLGEKDIGIWHHFPAPLNAGAHLTSRMPVNNDLPPFSAR